MTLPQETISEISEKANLSTDFLSNDETVKAEYLSGYKKGWQAGATEWASNKQLSVDWVRASDKLPLHKAFWNMPGEHNNNECYFPVRIDGFKYRVGEIFDNREEGAPDHIYYFVINGKDYFQKDFHRIEWLGESGATEWSGKAQGLADAMESMMNINASTMGAARMKAIAATALAKYKEVSNANA